MRWSEWTLILVWEAHHRHQNFQNPTANCKTPSNHRNGGLLLHAPKPQTLASRTDSRIPNPAIRLHCRAPIPERSRCGRRRRNQRKRCRCRSNSRCITRRMSPSLASSWRSGGRWCRSRTGSRRTTTSPSPKPTAASAPPRSQSGPSRTSRTSSNYILFWNPFHENPRPSPPSLSHGIEMPHLKLPCDGFCFVPSGCLVLARTFHLELTLQRKLWLKALFCLLLMVEYIKTNELVCDLPCRHVHFANWYLGVHPRLLKAVYC